MNKLQLRALLMSSATLVLPAVSAIVLPSAASAQTVCSADGSNTITCADGSTVVATGTASAGTTVNAVPQGLSATSAGAQTTTLTPGSATSNTITTTAAATNGIDLSAAGALVLDAGGVNVTASGLGSDAVHLSGASVTATLGNLRTNDFTSFSTNALEVVSGGAINVTTGTLSSARNSAVISGGTGAISLTTGDVAASQGNNVRISGTGSITLNTGNILGGGSGQGAGIDINGGAGAINVTTGNITRTGLDFSHGLDISGTGTITVNVNGDILAAGQDSVGILINGGAGAIQANFGNVAVNTLDATGVQITGTGGVTINQRAGTTVSTSGARSSAVVLTGGTVSGTLANIATTGASADAVLITGSVDGLTIGNISTTGPGAQGLIVNSSGPVDLTVGDITATDTAIDINGGPGQIDLVAGNISTTFGRGVEITGNGIINVDTGNITSGFDGINISGLFGPVDVSTGSVTILDLCGILCRGIVIQSANSVNLDVGGDLTTTQNGAMGILITGGSGLVTASFGNISTGSATTGNAAAGVYIDRLGSIEVNQSAGTTVHTSGDNSPGLYLNGLNISGTLQDVSTAGANSTGLLVTGTDVDLTIGNVSTSGASSAGIRGFTIGDFDVAVQSISTEGDNSPAAFLGTLGFLDFTSGLISTAGTNSRAIDLSSFVSTLDIAGITTTGAGSDAAILFADVLNGSIGDVSASGVGSNGLDLHVRWDLDLTVGNISAWGRAINVADALGVDDVTLTTGNITAREAMFIDADGAINVHTGDIAVSAFGPFHSVAIQGGAGPISLSTGNITSTGDHTTLVDISGSGAITTDLGNISGPYAGLNGLVINAGGTGNLVTAGFGDISLQALNSTGVQINAAGNNLVIDGGNVATAGPAVQVTGAAVSGSVGNLSTTEDSAVGLLINATGAVSATLGAVSTLGEFATAVAVTGSGPITLHTGAITTNDNEASGVIINGGAGAINLTTGTILAQGQDLFGVRVIGTGPITTTTGAITTTESSSTGLAIDGGAGLVTANFSNIDTLDSGRPALRIFSTGAIALNGGSATLRTDHNNSTTAQISGGSISGAIGNLIASGSNSVGLSATATGSINLSIGTATTTGNAIVATTTGGGAITLNLTGNVASSGGVGVYTTTNTPGALTTVNVAAGSSVTGSTVSIWLDGVGTAVVNNSGTIGTPGGLAIGTQVGVPVTINNLAGATLNGRVDLSHGVDSIINAGTWNVSGLNDFLNGSDAVSNLVGGIINVAPATSFARLETFTNAGTVNVTGGLTFTTVAPNFTNSGTFNLGSGSAVTGMDFFANSGTIVATGGTASIGTTFGVSNSGTITLVDGAANDVLTINGLYGGNGGTLAIDVVGTPAGNTADLLRVTGTIASGPTIINPNFVNPAIDPDGVLVVDGGGNIAANAFTLGGVTSQGLINYSLITQGNDVFLATAANAAVFDAGLLGRMNEDMWYQSADGYLACAASRRNESGADRKTPVSICGHLYWGRDRSGERNRTTTLFGDTLTYSDRLSTHRRGAQLDLGARAGDKIHLGITAGYEHAEARLATGSDLDLEGHNIGAYAQYGGELGFYAGLMVKRDRYDARFSNPAISAVKLDAKSSGIDGELGWRLRGFGALVDLNAGLSHVRSKLDDFAAGNIVFDNHSATSLRGRLGARMTWSGEWAPFIAATAFHEFKGEGEIGLISGTAIDSFDRRGRGTWARVEGGLGGGARGGPLLSVWGDFGDVKGWGLKAGFRF